MNLPVVYSHLEKYESLNGKTFTQKGNRYKIHVNSRLIKYPYAAKQFDGAVENLDCADEFKFSCLNDYETFYIWSDQLEKMLGKLNKE